MRAHELLFRSADHVDRVWRAAVAVSVATATLILFLFPSITHEYDARLGRDAARAPVEALTGGHEEDVLGYWGAREDHIGADEVSVAFLMPVAPSGEAPPGLRRWPRSGEVFASSEVLRTPGGKQLIARYGTLAGTVDASTLTDSRERVMYVGIDASILEPPPYWVPVTGFGISVDPARGDLGVFGSTRYESARSGALLLALAFGLAPMLVMVSVMSRLGGDRRRANVTLAVALGASHSQVRASLWRTVRTPLIVGLSGSLVVAEVLMRVPWTVPYTGYVMQPSATADLSWTLLACAAAAGLLTWAATWLGVRPHATSFLGPRPAKRARTASSRPLVGLVGTLIGINWAYAVINPTNPTLATVVLFIGVTACMLLLGPATSSLVASFARASVRAGRRRSWPTALVVGRELSATARSAVRATVFMGVVTLTATFAAVLATQPGEMVLEAQAASDADAGRSISFQVPDGATWLPRLESQLPPHEHLVQVVQDIQAPQGRLVASCATQVALLSTCASRGALPLHELGDDVPVALRVWGLGDAATLSAGDVGAGQVLVVSDDGSVVDTALLADTLRGLTSPVPALDEPGAHWIVGANVAARQARWIVVLGILACVLGSVMGGAGLLTEIVRLPHRQRVVVVYAGTARRHLALGAGLVGVPLLVGGVLGGVTAYLASYSAIHLGSASDRPVTTLLIALTSIAALVAAAGAAGAAVATLRSAPGSAFAT